MAYHGTRGGDTGRRLSALLAVAAVSLASLSVPLPRSLSASGEPAPATEFTPWWNYGWSFRAPLTIDNSQNSAALTNYPVRMNLSLQSLISSGKLRGDCADLRFIDSDGATELSYWFEPGGDLWLKVPGLPARACREIYMYYGNPSATPVSDASKVFPFFDDFTDNSLDSSKWQRVNGGSPSLSDGFLTISANNVNPGKLIAIKAPSDDYYAIRARFKVTGGTHDDERIGLGIRTQTSDGRGFNYVLHDLTNMDEMSFLDDNVRWYVRPGNWAKNTWYIEELYYDGSNGVGRFGDGGWQTQAMSGRSGYPSLNIGSYDGTSVWDWALVRPCRPPEPTARLGQEERPVKFRSFSVAPVLLDEGDTIELNATFENPAPDEITIRVSFHDGESFEGSREICATELPLAPHAETGVNFTWIPDGGGHTLWLAIMGTPLASRTIYVNRYPRLTPVMDQTASQGKSFRLLLFAEDADGDRLNWSEDCPLFNITPRGGQSAEINFTPTNDEVGNYTVRITVSDPRGCADSKSFKLTVKNVNDYPVIEPIRDQSVAQDTEFRYKAKASDIDEKWGDHVTFSDDSMLFDIDPETGEFSFTPTNEQVGRYAITITATDKQKASASTMFNLTVTNVNDPPAINPIEPQTVLEDELWQAVATATDPDLKIKVGEELRFSDDTFLFDIDPMTGLMSFTPTNENIGVLTANITVTDLGGLSSTTTVVITVLNTNDPPALDRVKDATATEDELFEMTVTATDPDLRWGLDNLTFSDDSPLFDIDPRTGKISFTPGNEHVGKHLITIKVTDESGASDKATFSITVLNVNDPPFNVRILSPADGERIKEGMEIWLNASAEDIDAFDVLRFSWFDNGEPLGDGNSIKVKLKPGRHTLSLEVSDGAEKALAEVSIVVLKAERVTVADYSWVMGAGIGIALILILVVLAAAFIAVSRRRRRAEGEEAGAAGAPGAGIEGAATAPGVSAAAAGAGAGMAAAGAAARPSEEDEILKDAKSLVAEVEDALAEHLEKHPEGAARVSGAMEKLDLARDFIKEGDGEAAMEFALEARGALAAAREPAAPPGKKVRKQPGGLRCPSCGEALEPEWPVCPACGHETR